MNKEAITTRALMLAGHFHPAQIRLNEGRIQTGLSIVKAGSRKDFLRRMREAEPDVVIFEATRSRGMSLREVLELTAEFSAQIPVVVLGKDGESGQDAIRYLEEGASDYVPLSHVDRLPEVVHRLQRDREAGNHQRQLETEIQQASEALLKNQKLMSMGRLMASVVHEINNPLESITNLLYLLGSEPGLSKQTEAYLALADKEMQRVAQISRQTLHFYRETPAPVRVRPSELLEEVLILYAPTIAERGLQIVRQYETDAELLVFPGEMRQVLSNLVTNAIEANSPGGKLVLRVRSGRQWSDEGINGIRIVVADNGTGMTDETRQRLGQIFFTTKGQKGTGLGLWVSQAIVKRYGGNIQICSSTRASHHGTAFSIFIPTNMRPQAVLREDGATRGKGGGHRGAESHAAGGGASNAEKANDVETGPSRIRKYRNLPLAAS